MTPAPNPPRILLVGESFLDAYHVGTATRLSPEGPHAVVSIDDIVKLPGGAANVAENLGSFGAAVQYLTAHAGVKNRLIANGVQIARWDERDGCLGFADSNLQQQAQAGWMFDAVVLSDYAKGLFDAATLQFLQKYADLPFFIDTKASPAKFAQFAHATFFPNAKEYAAHRADYNALSTPFVLKRGAEGLEWWPNGQSGPEFHVKALARGVNSVVGAGDVVLAAWTYNFLRYENPRSALHFASAAAALAVSRPYTTVVPLEDVESFLQNPLSS